MARVRLPHRSPGKGVGRAISPLGEVVGRVLGHDSLFTVGEVAAGRNMDLQPSGGSLALGSSPGLRNAAGVPTLSQPMSRMHLNAYLVPAASSKAAGTSRCLWIRQERPTFDPRSGV